MNANADELVEAANNIAQLGAKVVRQKAEIERLQALVVGLGQLLLDKGVIREDELDQSVEAASHPPEPGPDEGPYRSSAGALATPTAPTDAVCARCKRVVPVGSTNITATGLLCDQCFNQ